MNRRDALKKTAWLMGASVATPALLTQWQACQNVARPGWQPLILNNTQARTVSALVDTILPATDTPGALDLNVDVFIDLVIKELMPAEAQQNMLAEIDAFDARAQEALGTAFAEMDTEQRHEILTQEEAAAGTYNPNIWGGTIGEQEPVGFYREIKSLTLWGYFTSEHIGKEVLVYDPIPGEQIGCIPVSEVGNSWSL